MLKKAQRNFSILMIFDIYQQNAQLGACRGDVEFEGGAGSSQPPHEHVPFCVTWTSEQRCSDSSVLGAVQTWFLSHLLMCVTLSKFFSHTEVHLLLLWNRIAVRIQSDVQQTLSSILAHRNDSITGRDILFMYQKPLHSLAERHGNSASLLFRVSLPPFPLAKRRDSWATHSQTEKASRMVGIYVAATSWFPSPVYTVSWIVNESQIIKTAC